MHLCASRLGAGCSHHFQGTPMRMWGPECAVSTQMQAYAASAGCQRSHARLHTVLAMHHLGGVLEEDGREQHSACACSEAGGFHLEHLPCVCHIFASLQGSFRGVYDMFDLPGTTFLKLPVTRKPVPNVSGLTLEKKPGRWVSHCVYNLSR